MGDILSQDEVDALLRAVEDGGVPTGGAAGGRGPTSVRTIDLTNLECSVEARLPGLRPLADRLARAMRTSLATCFGQIPQVAPRAVQLIKFGLFVERLPTPVSLQLFRLAPLRGQGMLVVSPALVGALLQVFFGGDPRRKSPPPTRQFSAIEQRVLERLARRLLGDLRDAFAMVADLECAFVRAETNPRFAATAAPHDMVLVLELGVQVEGCEDGSLTVCMPIASLDPVRARLQSAGEVAEEAPDAAWSERLRAALAQAKVEVTAELGTRRLSMREVLALRVGDVISLGTGREGPVVVRVEGRARFVGAPGVSGGQNAVRVTATV